ncbi:MAG: hypothetical protein HY423_13940 [Candidatus Lambdaproteobacteria bacterium]|nr:hypothetical protein [Candidatus Lambdaproteobacteria bacterium]
MGFTEEQASLLSAKYEETAQALGQDLKTFFAEQLARVHGDLKNEISGFRAEMDRRFELTEARMRAELQGGLRDQLMKFIAVMAMMISLAVAIIKLFPNAG